MGVIIFLRKKDNKSYFRHALFSLIEHSDAESIIISSGYFQELPNSSMYSVSNDSLINVLKKSHISEIYVGGCMSSSRQNMNSFVYNLQQVTRRRGARFNVIRSIKNFNNWHAKVSIILDKNKIPLAAIIGSSNMTRTAFGENRGRFNVEADVLIWVPGVREDNYFDKYKYLEKSNEKEFFDPFYLVSDPKNTKQENEGTRLKRLFEEIRPYFKGL